VNIEKNFEHLAELEKGTALAYYDEVAESKVFDAHDGIKIHYSQIINQKNNKLLVVLPGRTEPSAKYAELAFDLRYEGYDIVIVDHRGQGHSDRLLENNLIGHVDDFNHYVLDLEKAVNQIADSKNYTSKKMLAHSMGTIIGLLHAEDNPGFWDGIVLGSPMLQIKLKTFPQWYVESMFKIMRGMGMANGFVPDGGPHSDPASFEGNIVTHSKERFNMARFIEARDPSLYVSSPSPNWVLEGFKGSQKALEGRHVLKMPILLFQAELDDFVEESAQNEFASTLMNCKKIRFKGAYHEIFQEKDSIRDLAIKSVKRFLK
jgi:lysophospholipase